MRTPVRDRRRAARGAQREDLGLAPAVGAGQHVHLSKQRAGRGRAISSHSKRADVETAPARCAAGGAGEVETNLGAGVERLDRLPRACAHVARRPGPSAASRQQRQQDRQRRARLRRARRPPRPGRGCRVRAARIPRPPVDPESSHRRCRAPTDRRRRERRTPGARRRPGSRHRHRCRRPNRPPAGRSNAALRAPSGRSASAPARGDPAVAQAASSRARSIGCRVAPCSQSRRSSLSPGQSSPLADQAGSVKLGSLGSVTS